MLVIGPHISISKGFGKAAQTAVDIGANTFQFFSRKGYRKISKNKKRI